jgi:cellulose synthase/poly-beta-1,6-N-acetylglucosamine synthase-like glycosyltransferase
LYFETVHLTSKQQALDTGVKHAEGDWLLFTDADMTFGKQWISLMATNAQNKCDFVFGHTSMSTKMETLFSALQEFQLEFLFASAYSLHAASLDSSCMGNNIMIKKSAYAAIGGQQAIGYSIVEDRDLYARFKKAKYTIAPMTPFFPTAYTKPCESYASFYQQMLRWARGGFSRGPLLLAAAGLFSLQTMLFVSALSCHLPMPLTICTMGDFLLTLIFVASVFKRIGSKVLLTLLPVYYLFVVCESVVFLVSFIITPKLQWKKQTI